MATVTICNDFGAPKNKVSVSIISPSVCQQVMGTVTDFIFLGPKITADGDCSHEIKRHLLLGRKVMTNIASIVKSRDITLPTKVRLVKAIVFPVVIVAQLVKNLPAWFGFACGCPAVPAPFVKKSIVSLLDCVGSFVRN